MKKISQPLGFTFLEVLLALSLFMVGIISVLQVFPVNRRYLAQSSMTTQAVYLGQEQIEKLRGLSYTSLTVGTYEPLTAMGSGQGDVFNLFQRETIISHIDPDVSWQVISNDKGMKKVQVQVSWQEGRVNRQYILATYVYRR